MTYALRVSDDENARYRMMAARAREQESELWQLAGLVRGARVADVGCGPGAMLAVIAETVAPEGRAVGVDADPVAVASARATLDQLGYRDTAVLLGRADATGLAPGSVDVAVLRHVLAHNGGREPAIVAHLAGLVRPGGCVYLVDVDVSRAVLADHPDLVDLDERYQRWHAERGNDLRVGHRLAELVRESGLEVLRHEELPVSFTLPAGVRGPAWAARDTLVSAGLASTEDLRRWDTAHLEVDARPERPVVAISNWAAVGRRTGP